MHLTGTTGVSIRSPNLTDVDFQLIATESSVTITAASNTNPTVLDAAINRVTTALIDNRFTMTTTPAETLATGVLSSTNGTIAGSVINRLASGSAIIALAVKWLRKGLSVTFTRTGGVTTDTFLNYVAGSLSAQVTTAIAARAASKDASHLPIFSTMNHTTPTYVRNTACWMFGIDMTAISPWNSSGVGVFAGTAITPRHILFASHYQIPADATIRFIANDNTVITRTVTSVYALPGGYDRDTAIGLLDSDLPASITPLKLFPSNLAAYIPTLATYGSRLPVVALDQEEKILAKTLSVISASGEPKSLAVINSAAYPALTETIISGDSGNPICILVDGVLVLLSMWTTANTGPALHSFIGDINTGLTSLGGGYQVSTASLAGFTSY